MKGAAGVVGAEDPRDVERARVFWAEEDVDQVWSSVLSYLDHLRTVLKQNRATDKELVQALKLLQSLDLCPAVQDPSGVQVVINSGEAPHHSPAPSTSPTAPTNGLSCPVMPVQLQPHPHICCKTCIAGLPSIPQALPLFWAQNPLKVPLLCGFKRLMSSEGRGEQLEADCDVYYRAPCGQRLRNHDDVMDFLWVTETFDVLQVDFFTFNRSVQLDPPVAPGSRRPELDLSRGVEPTPVELCLGDSGARPTDFRYRKDRWPHGCFLSRGPALFNACCDCVDGCTDAQSCACIAMNRGGRRYSHHRLREPEPSGLYECGPWCGCDRTRCQNRLVQRGIRVRLQVFQTEGRGWGVRCRDDVDRGTFVCIYAGVILQQVRTPLGPSPPKLSRCDLPSDDEVQVVTEWLSPPVLKRRSSQLQTSLPPTSSPPLHVPVIQRPPDVAVQPDRDTPPPLDAYLHQNNAVVQRMVELGGSEPLPPSGECSQEKLDVSLNLKNGSVERKRAPKVEDVYVLDATQEGNVCRFINHSCRPNLFIQNVFTDCHDPAFPVIAFFTSRSVKAGTELTWNYSANRQMAALPKREVACLCRGDGCRCQFLVEENLCEVCEGEGR